MVDSVQARLKKLITESGFKQNEIAASVGVSPQAITKWLKSGSIEKKNLLKLCALLNINYEWVITGIGNKQANPNQYGKKTITKNMEVREPALLVLSRDEEEMLTQYRQLTPDQQQYMRVCLHGLYKYASDHRAANARPHIKRHATGSHHG